MTRTEIITKELLEAVDRPEAFDAVYFRHADSRGPFYKALAEGTGILRARHHSLVAKVRQEKERETTINSSVADLENRLPRCRNWNGQWRKI